MSVWKHLAGFLVGFAALAQLGTAASDEIGAAPGTLGRSLFAVATFVSVLLLHWLLWRYIVPARIAGLAELTAFAPAGCHRKASSNATVFGYLQIAMFCLAVSGQMPFAHRFAPLTIGLLFIFFRMADRLRELFHTLENQRKV